MLYRDEMAAIERRGDVWNTFTLQRSPADDQDWLARGINQIARM
jgi:hypothetical protein